MYKNKIVIWIVLGLIVIAAVIYYFNVSNTPAKEIASGVVCTMEAKQCPDGSYVGRTGPKCEFSACPTTSITNPTNTSSLTEKTGVTTEIPSADLYK